jgi:hypothetical protein
MFTESFYFWNTQNSAIIQGAFPSKQSPCATIHSCQWMWRCWKHSWEPICESLFSSTAAFLIMSVASQKRRPFNANWNRGNRYKPGCQIRSMGRKGAPVLPHYSLLRNPRKTRPVSWSIVVKRKRTVGSPYFGAFPSDRIPKVTNYVKVNFFIHSINSCKWDTRWSRWLRHCVTSRKVAGSIPDVVIGIFN